MRDELPFIYDKTRRKWHADIYKITLIYAQAHKIASESPNSKINYNFFDDRIDILTNIFVFYSKNPELLPKNIILNLNLYNGYQLTTCWNVDAFSILEYKSFKEEHGYKEDDWVEIRPLFGTGEIDFNYRNTIKASQVFFQHTPRTIQLKIFYHFFQQNVILVLLLNLVFQMENIMIAQH